MPRVTGIINCVSSRIMTVTSADEFYSIMGVLTREMLEFTDTNNLIKVECYNSYLGLITQSNRIIAIIRDMSCLCTSYITPINVLAIIFCYIIHVDT